jgi:hypothetical protein
MAYHQPLKFAFSGKMRGGLAVQDQIEDAIITVELVSVSVLRGNTSLG